MSRPHRITDRPEWPDVLKRLEELAAQGVAASAACRKIPEEFEGFSTAGLLNTMRRGDVPCYPSNDSGRVEAWRRGEHTYRRYRPCIRCGEWIFTTADARCVQCEEDWKARKAGRIE